jgi:hypothetical protein
MTPTKRIKVTEIEDAGAEPWRGEEHKLEMRSSATSEKKRDAITRRGDDVESRRGKARKNGDSLGGKVETVFF